MWHTFIRCLLKAPFCASGCFIWFTSIPNHSPALHWQYIALYKKNSKMLFAEYAKRKETLENEQAEAKCVTRVRYHSLCIPRSKMSLRAYALHAMESFIIVPTCFLPAGRRMRRPRPKPLPNENATLTKRRSGRVGWAGGSTDGEISKSQRKRKRGLLD
jgi:hypothetical protein